MGILGVTTYDKTFAIPGTSSTQMRVATRVNDGTSGSGDSTSFSSGALAASNQNIAAGDKFSASSVSTTLVDGSTQTAITFNNASGAISWNGKALNLAGFADARKDDIVVKNGASGIDVYNLTTGQQTTLTADGQQQKGSDGKLIVTTGSWTAASLSVGLFINNGGSAAVTGSGNDIIINRQAGANIDADAGDDKIFNMVATATTLKGGAGNDAVYSVGLTTNATIDTGAGNDYVKLAGSMLKGGTITLGDGYNIVDASGQTLTGVTISDAAGANASALIAGSLAGGTSVTLNAAEAAVDVRTIVSSNITFGTGANSLVADSIKGTAASRSNIMSSGMNTYKINGAISDANIGGGTGLSDVMTVKGAISNANIKMGGGTNILDATGQNWPMWT